MSELDLKSTLRKQFLLVRAGLSPERRAQAAADCLKTILPLTEGHPLVFSYANFKDELETTALNILLSKQGKLVLSTMSKEGLRLFLVQDWQEQLRLNSWGILQPVPSLCQPVDPLEPTLVLVPAIAFDRAGHRLGYGHGMYDRLLKTMGHAQKIGIGFREQWMGTQLLPSGPHDVAVSEVILF